MTVVSSVFCRADCLSSIGALCLYQRAPVVGVPVVLADNAATPSLAPLIISQSARSPDGTPQLPLRITKGVIALLQQHASAKNTTCKDATSAAPALLMRGASGKRLDTAACQLKKPAVMSKCCGRVPQLCGREAAMDLSVLTVESTTRFSSVLRRGGGAL